MRKIFEVIDKIDGVQVPEVLYHRLRQKVNEFKPRELRIMQILKRPVPAYALAAIIVIFSLVFGISKGVRKTEIQTHLFHSFRLLQ